MNKHRREINTELFHSLKSNKDKLKFLLEFARIAPSSHNTQPWLFEVTNSSITISPNLSRKLPIGDPNNRQLFLSLGAVVANILLAADGYGLTVSRSDNLSKSHYSIHLKFLFPEKKDTSNNKLLDSIIERHTNRSKFTKELPPAEFLEKINDISSSLSVDARIITDESVKSQMVQIFGESVEASLSDKNFVSELSQWIKSSLSKHKDGMPGYSIGIPWLFSFIMPSLIKTGKIGGLIRKADEQVWTASPLFVVLSSKDDLSSWVKVGEVFERLAVAAQGYGVSTGIHAAPIEYGDFYKQFQKVLNIQNRPLMFLRFGYATKKIKLSPRLLLESLIKK